MPEKKKKSWRTWQTFEWKDSAEEEKGWAKKKHPLTEFRVVDMTHKPDSDRYALQRRLKTVKRKKKLPDWMMKLRKRVKKGKK